MNKIFDSNTSRNIKFSGRKIGRSFELKTKSSIEIPCDINYFNRIKIILYCENISGPGEITVSVGSEKVTANVTSRSLTEVPIVLDLKNFVKNETIKISSSSRRSKVLVRRIIINSGFVQTKIPKSSLMDNKISYDSKICFIIPYSIYGGAEVYLKNILESNYYTNYKVMFISKNKLSSFIGEDKVIYSSYERMNRDLEKYDFDVICFYNSKRIHDKVSRFKGKKRIVEIYHSDLEWSDSVSSYKNHKSDWIIRISNLVGNNISDINKISSVLPPQINFDKFIPKKRNANLIGTVARLSKEKNLKYLVDLKGQMPEKDFVVFGDGSEDIKRSLEGKGIRVLGFKEDIHNYYNFGAFVLPSNMEGLPITVIESLACNVPVIMKDVGGAKDILEGLPYDWTLTGVPAVDSKKIKTVCNKKYNFRESIKPRFNSKDNSKKFFEEIMYGIDTSKLWSATFNPNDYFDEIYCVNLDSRPDKWKAVRSRFTKWGLKVKRYSARYPRHPETEFHWRKLGLIEPDEKSRRDKKMMTKIGEVGCYLSHLNIIREAKAAGHKKILIFEDDVIFNKNFQKELKFIRTVPDWAIIYLGASQYSWGNVRPHSNKFYYSKDTDGTFAYAINLDYYDEIESALNTIEHPVDWDLRIGVQDKLPGKCLTFFPNIVIADTKDSDIRGGRDLASHCGHMRWRLDDYEI